MADLKAIQQPSQPSRDEAEKAVETLLRYIGEDVTRSGLLETPARMVRAFDEHYAGYKADPAKELQKTFEDIKDYDDFILVKDIEFVSHCEHHLEAILGIAHVAYWPDQKVVGISKLARIVDIYAKRLISQENMTLNIANLLMDILDAKGAAVMIDANHQCMSTRGVRKPNSSTVTTSFKGVFKEPALQQRFTSQVKTR